MVSAPPTVQSWLLAAWGAQFTNASIAASSHDLKGPRPAGTCTEIRSQRSPCASDALQFCELSRSCTTAMKYQGTPVFSDTATYRALMAGAIRRSGTPPKFRLILAFAQRSAFNAFRAMMLVIHLLVVEVRCYFDVYEARISVDHSRRRDRCVCRVVLRTPENAYAIWRGDPPSFPRSSGSPAIHDQDRAYWSRPAYRDTW